MNEVKHPVLREVRRFTLITLGAILFAFNLTTFVRIGGIIPAGFTGVTLLVQEIFRRFFNIEIPFSIIVYIINAVPAIGSPIQPSFISLTQV